MILTWLGHSSVLLVDGAVRIVADPLLRQRIGALCRVQSLPGSALALLDGDPPVDVVLISHLHHDHCDLASLRQLRAGRVIVPPGAGPFLAGHGIGGVLELAPGQCLELAGELSVTAVPAEHLGRREPWGPTAACVGHLVETPTASVWLAGDTGLFDALRGVPGLGRRGVVDVAVVPVWGWGRSLGPGHLDPLTAAEAVRRVGASHGVPVHWGTLHPAGLRRLMRDQLSTPGARFAAALTALDGDPRVLPLGGSLSLPDP